MRLPIEVQAAAHLECAGRIVILVLDEDVEAGLRRQQRMAHQRRRLERAIDARPRRVDVVQCGRVHIGTTSSGLSVINASTPQPSSRRASSAVSTVHTCTPSPARWASSTNRGDTTRVEPAFSGI